MHVVQYSTKDKDFYRLSSGHDSKHGVILFVRVIKDPDLTASWQVLVADRVPSGQGADGSGVASPVRAVHDGEDGGKSAEEMIQGNEKEAEEKREEPHDESKRSSGDVDEEDYPATFADLCLQMTDRANFLLEVSTSTLSQGNIPNVVARAFQRNSWLVPGPQT